MHELSICRSLLGILEQQAQAQQFVRVRAVWLTIGPWAAVEPEALRFSFDVASRATVADGARLILETTSAHGWCSACHADVAVRRLDDPCPCCGAYQVHKRGGDELIISKLEVE